MSIRETAEKLVDDYHDLSSPHCADKVRLIDCIVNLAIATYNKGIARATDVDEVANSGRLFHRPQTDQ